MEDRFPEEEYRRVCSALKPSFQAEQEVVNMAEPGKRPWRKKKAFVTLAAVLALTLSVSIVSVAATDGKIVEEVKDKVSLWFRNLTLDEEASTQDHMVLRAEDGMYIAIDQDERNPKLVYHEDSKSLGLAIGGQEIDITEELLEDGVYTTEYTYEGKTYGVTIQGELETAQMKVEPQ